MQPLDSIEPFIERYIKTVPINSTIEHNYDDKGNIISGKVFKVPKNWPQYKDKFNEVPTQSGGIITGPDSIYNSETDTTSGIIVIDCDSPTSYQLIKALDPTYKAIAESNPDKGGSFFYLESSTLPTINRGPFDLEIFNGGAARMVFLPTESNKTKKHWYIDENNGQLYNHNKELIEFRPMPENLRDFLSQFAEVSIDKKKTDQLPKSATPANSAYWAPLVQRALESGEYNTQFFKVLTPKRFRDLIDYKLKGTLHPNDIPEGQGSDYLASIAYILAHDPSIDEELFTNAIYYVNNLWDEPMPEKRIHNTIIKPKLESDYWQYNKDWKKLVYTFESKLEEQVEFIYLIESMEYVEINYDTQTLSYHKNPTDLKNRLVATIGITTKAANALLPDVPIKYGVLHPHLPFGQLNDKEFNLFIQTPGLKTLNEPDEHFPIYEEPIDFIKYMENFIPDKEDRDYFLSFWKTKFTTFEYSAVIFLVVGVQGSGKGTFIRILQSIIGESYVAGDIKKEQFLGQYNKWLENKYIAVLEEMAGQLTPKEAAQANEILKGYSGSETFAVRGMRTEHRTVPQRATFILNQNEEHYNYSEEDRRYYIIDTPNKMDKLGNKFMQDFNEKLKNPKYISDICYYIAKAYSILEKYRDAPMTAAKEGKIMDKMPLSTKLFTLIYKEEYIKLIDFLNTFATPDSIIELFSHYAKGILYIDDIVNVYVQHPSARMDESAARLRFIEDFQLKGVTVERTTVSKNGIVNNASKITLPNLIYSPIKKMLDKLSIKSISDEDDGLGQPQIN